MVLDVRAHTTPQWKNDPASVFPGLLDVLSSGSRWWNQFGAPIAYAVTIPNFLDAGNFVYTNGESKVFLEWVRSAPATRAVLAGPGAPTLTRRLARCGSARPPPRQLLPAIAQHGSTTVRVLNARDSATSLVQGGLRECEDAATEFGLKCAFDVEVGDVAYDQGTFYEEGLGALASAALDVTRQMAAAVGDHFRGFGVSSAEAIWGLLTNASAPPIEVDHLLAAYPDLDLPMPISIKVNDVAFLNRGAGNWTSLWSTLEAMRASPLDVVCTPTNVAVDATAAIMTRPEAVQAFLDEAAAHNVTVDLYLSNQNWAFVQYKDQVRRASPFPPRDSPTHGGARTAHVRRKARNGGGGGSWAGTASAAGAGDVPVQPGRDRGTHRWRDPDRTHGPGAHRQPDASGLEHRADAGRDHGPDRHGHRNAAATGAAGRPKQPQRAAGRPDPGRHGAGGRGGDGAGRPPSVARRASVRIEPGSPRA